MEMTVIYFGSYNEKHSRNRILIKGLRANGVTVIEVHDRSPFLLKYVKLFLRHWPYRHAYDFMIVGFPGFTVVPLARLIATAPVVFDAFVSYYDAHVFDRRIAKSGSLRARYFYYLDKISCQLAQAVLLETNSLINYFVRTFTLQPHKFRRIFIGANDEIFKPNFHPPTPNYPLRILFWGFMTPQHGVEHILQTAKILEREDLQFILIGGGPERQKMRELKTQLNLRNVEFLPPLPQPELVSYIQNADICLGAFGRVPRLKTVVTNKVYEALACRKPLITANEGAREVLQDGRHCLFCRPGDARDLAEKILLLKNDQALRERIAQAGYELYLEKFTPRALGAALKKVLEGL